MTSKSHSEQLKKQGGGIDFETFKKALSKQFGKQNAEFFAMAIRDNQEVLLEQSSRFTKLADWLEKEIRQTGQIINVFSPADKTEDYTQGQAFLWREQIRYIAELIYFYELLIATRTTTEQRENIEYTVCKLYGIHYSEFLEDYV